MRSYVERAQDFVKAVYPFIKECETKTSFITAVRVFNSKAHRRVMIASGLTRVALMTSDYVIKIDYDPNQIDIFGGCEDEMEIYAEAQHDGFAHLFAQITPFRYRGMNFYIMPRIEGVGTADEDLEAWDYMTEEECEWCHDHRIMDLHYKNFGFRKGRVCLVDYGARF